MPGPEAGEGLAGRARWPESGQAEAGRGPGDPGCRCSSGDAPIPGAPRSGVDHRGAQPCSLGPEEACSALSSASVHDPQSSAVAGFSPGPGAGSLLAKRVRARARVPLLDARSRFRLGFLLSRSPKCGPRAQPGLGKALPDAHVRVQLSSMFPCCVGRVFAAAAWAGAWARAVQRGPHPHPHSAALPPFSPRPFPLHSSIGLERLL